MMKKLILVTAALAFIGYGVFHTGSKQGHIESQLATEKKSEERRLEKVKPVFEKKNTNQEVVISSVPSLEDLEERFSDLDTEALKNEYERLSGSEKKARLLGLANTGKLSPEENSELLTYLRSSAAISKILIERKLEEVETL